ncbi:Calcium ion-binding protein [Rhynchospora pubera]|uniref:Calcium ion-binding protein n=1 Tax=Rhynchospora pubera TaxID=906938 RepID=A0AAV8EVU3_9POAL|nr:Calcium ion-binding protein [Rhynchospora pubera]
MHSTRPLLSRSGFGGGGGAMNLRPENLGQEALRLTGNLCFALFVFAVLVFTLIAATYHPDDPFLHPSSSHLTSFLTSTSNSTFISTATDSAPLLTGEDFINSSSVPLPVLSTDPAPDLSVSTDSASSDSTTVDLSTSDLSDSAAQTSDQDDTSPSCDVNAPIKCSDRDVFNVMMRATIDGFPDVHIYRFGKPVLAGPPTNPTQCDMAWRFKPKNAKRAALYKDYRRFDISLSTNCSYAVLNIGDYHTGVNARKKKGGKKSGRSDNNFKIIGVAKPIIVPIVGETVNDTLPVVESESKFSTGKYLVYKGGGDRCKSMNHYLWSFLCSLGEAQYLNRTLVMDLTICLNNKYTSSKQNEEGKDFRFYFDFEHLRDSASVIDQHQFWEDWKLWRKKDKLSMHLVEDFRVTPMKLANVKDTLIMRKFGAVEPDNYWYRVCEGETESVIQRPWHLLWKSRRLMDIVSGIASKMNWDFDSVHVVRGDKAKNPALWPNLAADTSPEALLSTLGDKIDNGRNLYIATDEPDTSFFGPLKDKYTTHFLDDYKELWSENSDWYIETKNLNNGIPVEFDGYMRGEVDMEVFLRGKKQIETFNDLTSDCKDGINTCKNNS